MRPKNRSPTHPGEMLLEEFLKPAGVTQKEFAAHLGWSYQNAALHHPLNRDAIIGGVLRGILIVDKHPSIE